MQKKRTLKESVDLILGLLKTLGQSSAYFTKDVFPLLAFSKRFVWGLVKMISKSSNPNAWDTGNPCRNRATLISINFHGLVALDAGSYALAGLLRAY
jgi:hypothetical protein